MIRILRRIRSKYRPDRWHITFVAILMLAAFFGTDLFVAALEHAR